jgi:3'-phosphoadenosine 5'-phosphosulfate sulfotransferase (PAPS reductase)/FAD synthetase
MDKVLLFSGGRQSCVLLYILEEYLEDTLVLWCNTGAASKATLAQLANVRQTVPHFQEIRSDQAKDISIWGYPSDIVPVRNSKLTSLNPREPKIQSTKACCTKNIWMPLALACVDSKVSKIYAGGKGDSPDISYPLHSWTEKMLQDYILKHSIVVPALAKSRLCWNCTGYAYEPDRGVAIKNLIYNDKIEVKSRFETIQQAVFDEYANLEYISEL